jgi:hypothetical protein
MDDVGIRYRHVIIENCMIVPVVPKQSASIGHTEIFEVKQAVWIVLPHKLYKSEISSYQMRCAYETDHGPVHEFIVSFPANALVRPSLLPMDVQGFQDMKL